MTFSIKIGQDVQKEVLFAEEEEVRVTLKPVIDISCEVRRLNVDSTLNRRRLNVESTLNLRGIFDMDSTLNRVVLKHYFQRKINYNIVEYTSRMTCIRRIFHVRFP